MPIKINSLSLFLYRIFLGFFQSGIHIASLVNEKARLWKNGRKDIWTKLDSGPGRFSERNAVSGKKKVIWMHCASLGEFEQGRPLLEKLRINYPGYKILLSFFSPSGYEVRKNYNGADWIVYLPMDGPGNAKRFLSIVDPSLVIFVKYEFWFYYLQAIKQNNSPLLLVSAIFRENSVFFKKHGTLQRKMLGFFDHLFVQDKVSAELLGSIGAKNVSVTGDTRFDRVAEIAEQFSPLPVIEKFVNGQKAIVAGSSWPPDERILQKVFSELKGLDLKLIIAPHEIGEDHIAQLEKAFPGAVRYSLLKDNQQNSGNADVLIIDNIGMLSKLYHYSWISYIGGGFGKGIHNTLEAAVYGKPVLFGPKYGKFREAVDLVQNGGAFAIVNEASCIEIIKKLRDINEYEKACKASGNYVAENRGATGTILQFIQEKRLLTS